MHVRLLITVTALLFAGFARAEPASSLEAPLLWQPKLFNGAVGTSFQVSMQTSRTELHADEAFELTIRVVPVGRWWKPPQRPRLDLLPKFRDRFYISRPNKHDRESVDVPPWEFYYRLQPRKNVDVQRVPPLPFIWYKPPAEASLPGYFPTTYAPEIDLTIAKRSLDHTSVEPIVAPAAFFHVVESDSILRHEEPYRLPGWPVLLLLLAIPPTGGVLWCIIWRRLYPDAVRLAQLKRSRAARQALHELQRLSTLTPVEQAARMSAITTLYVRHRFGLAVADPTPLETGAFLEIAGFAGELAEQAVSLLCACDAIRFAPSANHDGVNELAESAKALVLKLEEKSWSPRS